MPEIVLGVAMFVVVALVLQSIPLGTWAQLEGLGPTKCPTRHHGSGEDVVDRQEYEEAAIDLDARR